MAITHQCSPLQSVASWGIPKAQRQKVTERSASKWDDSAAAAGPSSASVTIHHGHLMPTAWAHSCYCFPPLFLCLPGDASSSSFHHGQFPWGTPSHRGRSHGSLPQPPLHPLEATMRAPGLPNLPLVQTQHCPRTQVPRSELHWFKCWLHILICEYMILAMNDLYKLHDLS